MGFDKRKRPIWAPNATVRGKLTEGGSTAAMSTGTVGGSVVEAVQSLTSASTATRITQGGTTVITSTGGDKTFKFTGRPVLGMRKVILVDINSTGEVTMAQSSTLVTFYNTTNGTVVFGTKGSAGLTTRVELIGRSTVSWYVLHAAPSTQVTFSA